MQADNYQAFLTVTGALVKLVIVSMLLERGLAVIFEHDWFVRLTTKKIPDPTDSSKTIDASRAPGLKGIVALLGAYLICHEYDFDVLAIVLNGVKPTTVDPLGVLLTSLIVAGGSAGAILIFQGYLNLSKEGRDAIVEAKQAQSAKLAANAAS